MSVSTSHIGLPRAWQVPRCRATDDYPFASRILVAPGAGGMFGEGYRYHRYPPFSFNRGWYNREDVVFQTKGLSAFACEGNMPLKSDGVTPEEFFPRCIAISFLMRRSLNVVGFSNFGFEFYCLKGYFDSMGRDWIINFMSIRPAEEEREKEVRHFARCLKKHWYRFKTKPRICMNHGCPNVEHMVSKAAEIKRHHQILRDEHGLGIEIYDNFSPVAEVELLLEIAEFSCGLFIANTIPYERLVRDGLTFPWGRSSPLQKRGFEKPGGGSGFRQYALRAGRAVRDQNKKILLIGGNGLQLPRHVLEFCNAGYDGVQVGMAPILLPIPGLMDSIIRLANEIAWGNR